VRRVVVIEANFRPYSAYERERLAALGGRPVEVHCACPPGVAAARYNARVTHPVHVITTLPVAAMAEYDRPVGIGDLVTVDTTRPVDVAGVAPRGAGRGAAGTNVARGTGGVLCYRGMDTPTRYPVAEFP